MAPPIDSVLQLGFRFEPSPTQAVTYYLPRLIAGEPMHAAIRPFIHATDIYACEPGVLAAQFCPTPRTGDRFFFTTCKRQQQKAGSKSSRVVRFAGPGSWHSHGSSADVMDGAGVKIGEVKKLRYKKGGEWTDWLMDEFSCCCSEGSVGGGDRQYVLCKIYVSPRARPDSAARQESDAAVFAPPPEEPVAAAHNKRKEPPVAEPSCPKRIRPPVVQPPPPSCVLPRIGTASSVTERPASNLAQPPPPSCVLPRIGTAPSVTQRPTSASNLAQPAIVPIVRASHMPVQAPPVTEPSCPKRIQAPVVQPPPPFRAPLPRIGMTPSVTQHPASNRALAIQPLVRACHMPVQAPPTLHQPSVQASTTVAARDPLPPAAPQEEDEEEEEEDDDFAQLLKGKLVTEQVHEERDAAIGRKAKPMVWT